jgi:hypothetical protein
MNSNNTQKICKNIYNIVKYDDKLYRVFKITQKENELLVVIDEDDYDKMCCDKVKWYMIGDYLGVNITRSGVNHNYYLHRVIKNIDFSGERLSDIICDERQKIYIDHISRNTIDNRKANLRTATQTEQNINQKQKKRQISMPENCGINISDLPQCTSYRNEKDRGECFEIMIKENNEKTFRTKTTSSSKYTLADKLTEAKYILNKLYETNPEIIGNRNIFYEYSEHQINLLAEYNKIISLTNFNSEIISKNIIKYDENVKFKIDIDNVSDAMKIYITNKYINNNSGKRAICNLSQTCNVTPDMIPKGISYVKETDKRGDGFAFNKNPRWCTTRSKHISTLDKYNLMIEKMQELNIIIEYN